MSLIEFIQDNFFYLEPGYTTFNTIIFGLVAGIIILLIIKMFKWLDKDPKDLFLPLIPFIFLGSGARALVDNNIYPLIHLLVTPGIYIFIGLTTILAILLSIFIEKKFSIDYRYSILTIGLVLCIPNLLNLQNVSVVATSLVLGVWLIFALIFILISKKWKLLQDKSNLLALLAHLFDASSTFIAVDFFGYWEQHVLPGALTKLTGTAFVLYPLKISVILMSLYIIDENIEDTVTKNTLKLCIFILGFAPGLRNFLSLIIGVY